MRIRLDLDGELADALLKAAEEDLRNVPKQAEHILRQHLSIPVNQQSVEEASTAHAPVGVSH